MKIVREWAFPVAAVAIGTLLVYFGARRFDLGLRHEGPAMLYSERLGCDVEVTGEKFRRHHTANGAMMFCFGIGAFCVAHVGWKDGRRRCAVHGL